MVQKAKSPLPPKTGSVEPDKKEVAPKDLDRQSTSEPMFVRGTIDPPTKKER